MVAALAAGRLQVRGEEARGLGVVAALQERAGVAGRRGRTVDGGGGGDGMARPRTAAPVAAGRRGDGGAPDRAPVPCSPWSTHRRARPCPRPGGGGGRTRPRRRPAPAPAPMPRRRGARDGALRRALRAAGRRTSRPSARRGRAAASATDFSRAAGPSVCGFRSWSSAARSSWLGRDGARDRANGGRLAARARRTAGARVSSGAIGGSAKDGSAAAALGGSGARSIAGAGSISTTGGSGAAMLISGAGGAAGAAPRAPAEGIGLRLPASMPITRRRFGGGES